MTVTPRTWRRVSQAAFLLLFAWLFVQTEYRGEDVIPYAVNAFLRFDPLVAGAAVVAGRALVSLVWPALVTVAAALLLGRFFCGWVCPMGSVIDASDALLARGRKGAAPLSPRWRRVKFLLLAALAASALVSLQLVFLLDPISLLIRSLAVSLFPALNLAVNALFDLLYRTGLAPVTALSEPAYAFLKAHLLAFRQPFFALALPVGILFAAILALGFAARRFWCRALCPLGALFGLLARWSPVRRRVDASACTSCGKCVRNCRTGAIAPGGKETARGECLECMDCREICPERAIRFTGAAPAAETPVDLPRRTLLLAAGMGALAAPLTGVDGAAKAPSPGLIRPPGALPEPEFLARCTRCGECMRVCVGNGLHPAFWQGGFAGLFSPILRARLGYCELNCTLCGQVCPTGAITRLEPGPKKLVKLGLASVDRSRCLPWRGEAPCIVCEEHCPTAKKAIRLVEEPIMTPDGTRKILQLPFVDEGLCIGCGICENKCPLTDRAAIEVTSRGESRAQGDVVAFLPFQTKRQEGNNVPPSRYRDCV